MPNKAVSFVLVVFFSCNLFAQQFKLSGIVLGDDGEPLIGCSIVETSLQKGASSSISGSFELTLPATRVCYIECSFTGYKTVYDTIVGKALQTVTRNYVLKKGKELEEIRVEGIKQRSNTLSRISMKSIDQIPNSSGNIETILKTFSGVASNNELTSQYSVRGGSYDENLIYVNDIEIYRPMLVQSATQEGLSFVNPNMVSGIQFSAGGFEAEYGDKMSSVLDITYKKPTEFEGTAIASLLGASLHLAGATKNDKFNFNTGIRYKTAQYLLSSLEVSGDYKPRIADIQSFITYNFNEKTSLSFLGNYSSNYFEQRPEVRTTNFGTLKETYQFNVFYEGQEKDFFNTYLGALSLNHNPSKRVSLKLIASAFQSNEEINYDFLKEYFQSRLGSNESQNDTAIIIGTGASLEHARKKLVSGVGAIEHKGSWFGDRSTLKWGLKFQQEHIYDNFNEWKLLDSAGISIPYSSEEIILDFSERATNQLQSFRYQAYLQNKIDFPSNSSEISITYGVRANYWTFNKDWLISPRGSVKLRPYWDRQVNFYLSGGLYGQAPFYKEMKEFTGLIFPNRRAQRSAHVVLGTDYYYKMWDRNFIFTTELYYKHLYDLIPYRLENIEVEYLPEYTAQGYAYGVDFRVYGEFVPGAESWFSLSLLKTDENIPGFTYTLNGEEHTQGWYRRPGDQRLTFSIFFQDYFPSNDKYKVHLLLNYGTGLPYSGPNKRLPSQVYQLNQYRRVDIGVSRIISRKLKNGIGLNDIWISAEILNLLGAKNMASYEWIRTVENNEGIRESYAIPNFLTGRRFNIKISTKLNFKDKGK